MTSQAGKKSIEYVNYRLGFKAGIPENFYKDQIELNSGVVFGKSFGYFIGTYPGVSINNLYNYAIQQRRNQALSVIKDEYTRLRDLPIRKCIFKSRSLHSEVDYVQGKRSAYVIAFFLPTGQMNDQVFGIMNAITAVVYSDKLQSILNSFEELPASNSSTPNYYSNNPYEDGAGALMAKRGLIDIGVGW